MVAAARLARWASYAPKAQSETLTWADDDMDYLYGPQWFWSALACVALGISMVIATQSLLKRLRSYLQDQKERSGHLLLGSLSGAVWLAGSLLLALGAAFIVVGLSLGIVTVLVTLQVG